MASINLFPLGLVLHITGVVLMAGGALGSYITLKQLWKYLPGDQRQATAVFKTSQAYNILFPIGGVLILISGFLLLRVFQFTVTQQLWFEVKMALVVFLVLNGRIFGGRMIRQLQGVLGASADVTDMLKIGMIKRRLGIFHALQLATLFLIFVLAVYKFQ